MTEITFDLDCTLDAQARYYQIHHFLVKNQVAVVEFRKKDGTLRTMDITLDEKLMPLTEAREFHQTRLVDYETMPVWSLGDLGWKSFKTMNVLTMKAKND